MDLSILEDIGLTAGEAKVFLALVEIGSSNAGDVIKRSGLQNAVVHRAFHSLIEKGLITYVKEGKFRKYQSIQPKRLLEFLEQKSVRLKKIIPELETKSKLAKTPPQATLFQGMRGVKELLSIMLDTTSNEYFAYGGPEAAHDIFGDFYWESFHNKRINKKIKAKLLFHAKIKWWADELNKRSHTKVKLTKKDFEEITETIICGERVAIIIYTDKPFGFLIEEEKAAQSYKKFFEILWGAAK